MTVATSQPKVKGFYGCRSSECPRRASCDKFVNNRDGYTNDWDFYAFHAWNGPQFRAKDSPFPNGCEDFQKVT